MMMKRWLVRAAWRVLQRHHDDWRWLILVDGYPVEMVYEKDRDRRVVAGYIRSLVEMERSRDPKALVKVERVVHQ